MRTMLTLVEAGKVAHRTVPALRQLMHRGKFPFTKIAGRVLIDSEQLDLFLKMGEKISAAEAIERVRGA